MKKITVFFFVLLAFVFLFPILFLGVGSLMGKNEFTDLLLPVMKEGSKGYASWKWFPEYPTLKNYVEVLLDSPEFFVMSRKKISVYFIYCTDDDALSGYAPWKLSGAG